MLKNTIAILLMLCAVAGVAGELNGWLLPTVSWPFTVSREMSFLHISGYYVPDLEVDGAFHWFGWLSMVVLFIAGLYLLLRPAAGMRMAPERAKRWKRFCSMKRAWWSFLLLLFLILLAALDQCVVGKRALAVKYEGQWYFPAFTRAIIPGDTFGLVGDDALAEADYRELALSVGLPDAPEVVVMPPIPYDPVSDAASFPTEPLELRKDGRYYRKDSDKPFNGIASRLYEDGMPHMRTRCRQGLPDGYVQGWSRDRREVYAARYSAGEMTEHHFNGLGTVEEFEKLTDPKNACVVYYHPAPPLSGGHLLGTDSRGADIAAVLYGGLQVCIVASLFYLPIIYGIGLTLGMLMGYFGGKWDMLVQRVIEILSQLPFLFVVMILADALPLDMRGMFLILSLLALFGWMRMTYLVRTATMKEKAREYVAAARVMGAGTVRVLLKHILPNITGIVVTLLPFSVAAVVFSLTSLDYLGFGLPESYASWGRLLNDGLSRLSSPWVVSSAFLALVITLLLVTFVGEGVREACDPRRRTYYE